MATRLLNRQMQIPGGMQFYIPPLKNWKPPRNASFNEIVQAAIHVLQANRPVANKLGWDLSYKAMADRVDAFNARLCELNGWDKYILAPGGSGAPKSSPRNQQDLLQSLRNAAVVAKDLVRGAKTLIEWKESGEQPVSQDQAEARAAVCVSCPKNDLKPWTEWFTVPAAHQIKAQVEEIHQMKLVTSHDADLKCCTACHCPLQVKVWPRIAWLIKRLSPDQLAKLKEAPRCWILEEAKL